MKLLTKTTLYFLLAMIPLLAAGGVFLFRQFSKEIDRKTDNELVGEELRWIAYLKTEVINGTAFILKTPDLLIYPVDEQPVQFPEIRDIKEKDAQEDIHTYRQLSHVINIYGTHYQLIIRKSQEQKAVLVSNVTWLMLLVFAGLFIVTMIFNWVISKTLWKPFNDTLKTVRQAELHQMKAVRFDTATRIKEFNELNTSLNVMSEKIAGDYLSMKEFTENAAHEMQTPLAVAKNKLELLIQDPRIAGDQMATIMDAETALNRLGKLNQSLLLLAKIDNHQFKPASAVNINEVIQKYLQLFHEMINAKNIKVNTQFEAEMQVYIHQGLAESLVSNLLGNAIKYNMEGGTIDICTTHTQLQISNTSPHPPLHPHTVFKRFSTLSSHREKTTGLGLAIVKKIADTHGLEVTYTATGGLHRFTLKKKNKAEG